MPKIELPRAPRRNARRKPAPPRSRRTLQLLLLFVTSILLADAIIGERGLLETLRARRRDTALQTEIAEQRQENARLREQARRLREDPAAIEAIARRDLGLLSPGEILFIIKDVKPASRRLE
ncbi:MAG: septum formation initiator family protein [Dehalococcoidia bacterium]|jgi:cell division protein FtsB|nr:septum formation initiator family protein [Dehalococcoidia bacterium]